MVSVFLTGSDPLSEPVSDIKIESAPNSEYHRYMTLNCSHNAGPKPEKKT